ncbi:hypothetical protein VKT23_012537 [Stygiomarasmius scandens]|uniref:BTB domain-containing protein n=1 Tax=Marasmiellus scandens TaxID=2682957 RepID=A0ABR1J5E0_9AGAR
MTDSKTKTSARFNANSDGDIVFSSSDEVLFYVHKKNLEFCSGGFPPADTPTLDDESIPLTEKASTLELLFAFVYPQRYPGLNDMTFEELVDLAEAAEKYEVYFAMSLCSLKMKEYVSSNAPEIFGFAARHDYPFLISIVAPRLISRPLTDVVNVIPAYMYIPWTLFKERWQQCLDVVCSIPQRDTSHVHSNDWYLNAYKVQIALSDISRLADLDTVFEEAGIDFERKYCDPHYGYCSLYNFKEWRDKAVVEVAKIPDFVTFLKTYAPSEIQGK